MIFEVQALGSPLNEFIESIFYFKDFMPEHTIERVVPTGHIFILFELDGIPRNTFDKESLEPNAVFQKVWVSGMHKNYLSISAHQKSEMLVIQLKPYGGFPVFKFPIHELNDRVIPAEEILGKEILELRANILTQKTPKDKMTTAENWLHKQMDFNGAPPKEITDLLHQLLEKPFTEHQSILQLYPKTQKHLIAQFKKFLGLTPKVLHRIIRFNDILQQIQHQKSINWSQITYLSGYADQSHFIKEFKEFSGFNPQEFILQDFHNKEANFFPLDPKG